MSEIDLWSEDWEDWEDEDGCYNGTLFDYTFQKKLYNQVVRLWYSTGSGEASIFLDLLSFSNLMELRG